jgi:tetratricopeptide (TPR) repeat protein
MRARSGPRGGRAHNGLGNALLGLERYADAEAAAGEALRLDPGYSWAHATLGSALHGLERYGDAEAAYR